MPMRMGILRHQEVSHQKDKADDVKAAIVRGSSLSLEMKKLCEDKKVVPLGLSFSHRTVWKCGTPYLRTPGQTGPSFPNLSMGEESATTEPTTTLEPPPFKVSGRAFFKMATVSAFFFLVFLACLALIYLVKRRRALGSQSTLHIRTERHQQRVVFQNPCDTSPGENDQVSEAAIAIPQWEYTVLQCEDVDRIYNFDKPGFATSCVEKMASSLDRNQAFEESPPPAKHLLMVPGKAVPIKKFPERQQCIISSV